MSESQPVDGAADGAADDAGGQAAGGHVIPEDLLEKLVCPLGKKPLRLENDTLVCTHCGARFKSEDGIPNMLLEEATLPEGITDIKELACYSESGEEA